MTVNLVTSHHNIYTPSHIYTVSQKISLVYSQTVQTNHSYFE